MSAPLLPLDDALALLPEGEDIHTLRCAGFAMFGADWSRASIVNAITGADSRWLADGFPAAAQHGLAISYGGKTIFIATDKAALARIGGAA